MGKPDRRLRGNSPASWATVPKALAACLEFDNEFDRAGERLGTYAFLKVAEDTANSTYQRMMGRYRHAASQAAQAASYIRPEIMAIPAAKMKKFLAATELAPHRLSARAAAALQAAHARARPRKSCWPCRAEMAERPNQVFRQLNDADLKFGTDQEREGRTGRAEQRRRSRLFLHSPSRSVRKTAFHQYYAQYQAHENTLAATLGGSVQRDVYYAKARGYPSALESCPVPRQRAAGGLRQSDRVGASPSAGAVSLLRTAAAEDAAARHPPLRHLRADPQRAGNTAHLEPGGRSWWSIRSSRWGANIAARWTRG